MTTRLPQALLSAIAVASLALTSSALAQKPQPRLTAPIDNGSRATLTGSQPPRVRMARDLGAVDGSRPLSSMTLVFSRSAAQQTALDNLIAAQQNPASPQFHQWLTPAEFGARFGMADADLSKAAAWLQSQGFTVGAVSPSRDRIAFSGTAATVATAFGAPLHRYALGVETHIAPSADLSLPSALAGVVQGVTGVSDFRPHPHVLHSRAVVRPGLTSSQTGNFFLTPLDIATIYDLKPAYNQGFNGSGQTIAVIGQSQVTTSDVTSFQTALGQAAKAPTITLLPDSGASTVYQNDESESDLDLEYSTGIAPGATINFVYAGANDSVFDALVYAIQNDVAPIITISYGECEPDLGQSSYNTYSSSLAQAAAQGQTVVSASGDSGSTDCSGDGGTSTNQEVLAVDFPASSQYVTGVGGTEFPAADVVAGNNTYFQAASGSDVVSSALSYIPEQVWNDDSALDPTDLSSGGGGVSIYTARPTWQTGVPGIAAGTFRLVPDVALDSSPNNAPYAYCSSDPTAWQSTQSGSCTAGLRDAVSQDFTVAGGTSFAAPIVAGMIAVLNQAKGYTSQGVINPTLYTLASSTNTYASAFHDVTSGSNNCNLGAVYCSTAGAGSFTATVGYDQASGLGSVDFYNLLSAWPAKTGPASPGFTVGATSISVTAGSTVASTVTVTPVNGYTGTIGWTIAPTTIPSACYSIANTAVTSSTPVTATLSITTGSSTCGSGYTAFVRPGSGSALLHAPAAPSRHSIPAAPVAFAGLGLLSLAWFGFKPKNRRRLPALLAILLLAGMGFGLSGCGGGTTTGVTCGTCGGGGTTPTTTAYTMTLIGTDTTTSAITARTTLTVTLTTTTQ